MKISIQLRTMYGFILAALALPTTALANETIQLGAYSGQPGYFVRVGKGAQNVLNAILMTPEAVAQMQKQKLKADINQTRTCEVEGLQQSIGYTIFAVKGCK